MTFAEIIRDNVDHHCPVKWWAKCAFHFTDILNAQSILESGYLYSRVSAEKQHVMANDNAGRQVIDLTAAAAKSKVRFYFRPLTPTQYYNEGFKHQKLQFDEANVPVPVFFLFDLQKLLEMKETAFSAISQARKESAVFCGADAFAKMPFDAMYQMGSMDDPAYETGIRQAELLYPDRFPIDSCLMRIICRNSLERDTLRNVILSDTESGAKIWAKYSMKIGVGTKDLYYQNGFFVSDMQYANQRLSLIFNQSAAKDAYMSRMVLKNKITDMGPGRLQLCMEVIFLWKDQKGRLLHRRIVSTGISYMEQGLYIAKIPKVADATVLQVQVRIEHHLMAFRNFSLVQMELL